MGISFCTNVFGSIDCLNRVSGCLGECYRDYKVIDNIYDIDERQLFIELVRKTSHGDW
jgi:hypothetical protein